jgi:hypothetical protein
MRALNRATSMIGAWSTPPPPPASRANRDSGPIGKKSALAAFEQNWTDSAARNRASRSQIFGEPGYAFICRMPSVCRTETSAGGTRRRASQAAHYCRRSLAHSCQPYETIRGPTDKFRRRQAQSAINTRGFASLVLCHNNHITGRPRAAKDDRVMGWMAPLCQNHQTATCRRTNSAARAGSRLY